MTAGVIATPSVVSVGCCAKVNLLAGAAVTLNADEAGVVVKPLDSDVRVKPLATVLICTPLNVAMPPDVVVELPALIVPDETVSVTVRPESVRTVLPSES